MATLPVELRLKIYHHTWESRFVSLRWRHESGPGTPLNFYSSTPPPITLRLNHEAREETMRHYYIMFGTSALTCRVWFNPSLDVAHLSDQRCDCAARTSCAPLGFPWNRGLHAVQHLSLGKHYSGPGARYLYNDLLWGLRALDLTIPVIALRSVSFWDLWDKAPAPVQYRIVRVGQRAERTRLVGRVYEPHDDDSDEVTTYLCSLQSGRVPLILDGAVLFGTESGRLPLYPDWVALVVAEHGVTEHAVSCLAGWHNFVSTTWPGEHDDAFGGLEWNRARRLKILTLGLEDCNLTKMIACQGVCFDEYPAGFPAEVMPRVAGLRVTEYVRETIGGADLRRDLEAELLDQITIMPTTTEDAMPELLQLISIPPPPPAIPQGQGQGDESPEEEEVSESQEEEVSESDKDEDDDDDNDDDPDWVGSDDDGIDTI